MKKLAYIMTLALFTVNLASAASLTLIQPNGGDLCLGQQNYQIKWTAVGVNEKIKLVLFQNDVRIASIVENLDAGGSPYLWKVGQYIGGTAAAGSGYKVRVRTMSNNLDDYSDAPFSLKTSAPPCQPPLPPPPTPIPLRVETPNGGEDLSLHHDYSISWKSYAPATVGNVRLELVRYQGAMLGVIKDNLPATGSWTWKAGEYPGNTAPDGKYLMRVRSLADPAIFDESDSFFNLKTMMIAAPPMGQPLFNKKNVTLAAVYQNFPCHDTFPSFSIPIPVPVLQQGWQHFEASGCGLNQSAQAGVYWFPYPEFNIQVAAIYRSRIIFYLSEYAGQGAGLKSAKLKMKRIHSIHEDANSGCGCDENLFVLMAPMTNYVIPAIGERVDIDKAATEFTVDITEVVKKWLDGSVVNNGLLLLAGELPCSGGRRCVSCYEINLVLSMN
ncbi:MAG TPA: hypothetical protein VF451_07050 [Acidobacteriota bacterium]